MVESEVGAEAEAVAEADVVASGELKEDGCHAKYWLLP